MIFDVGSKRSARGRFLQDFFTASVCKLNDIQALNEEVETAKSAFKSASFSGEDSVEEEALYKKLLMEIYFVRNINSSRSALFTDEQQDELIAQVDERLAILKNKMEKVFVEDDDFVTRSRFNGYFDEWTAKYDERFVDYARCQEGAFVDIAESLLEAQETLNNLSLEVEPYERQGSFFDVQTRSNVQDELGGLSVFDEMTPLYSEDYYEAGLLESEFLSGAEPSVADIAQQTGEFTFEESLKRSMNYV